MTIRVREIFGWPDQTSPTLSKPLMAGGGGLVLAGVLIVLFPVILVALVAGVIITVGLAMIRAGWRMRPGRSRVHRVHVEREDVGPSPGTPRTW